MTRPDDLDPSALQLPPHRPPALSQPTAMIQLSPDLLAQLKQIAPRKQRSKVWYVVLALLVAAGVFVAVSPAARTVVVTKGRAVIARVKGQPTSTPAPVVVSEPAPSPAPSPSPSVVETNVPPAVTTAAPPVSIAPVIISKPKTTPKKPQHR